MTDIRCPMCGRPNPPDQEVCRFCQARLKPLVAPPFAGDGAPIIPGETPVPRKTSDLEPTLPDWLRDLRGKQEDESEPVSEEVLPDWLSEQSNETPDTSSSEPADIPDWLRDLRGKEAEKPLSQQESLPDWLTEESEQAIPSGEASMDEAADWWSRISSESEPDVKQPAPEEEALGAPTGESLGSLPSAPEEYEEQPEEEKEAEGQLPDWLTALSSADFQEFESAQEEQPQQIYSDESPTGTEGEEPDWLQRVRARQQAEEQPPVPAFLPDEEESPQAEVFLPESPAAPDLGLPDWLSGASQQESLEGLPEWFTQSQQESTEAPAPEEGGPSWPSGLGVHKDDEFPWTETSEPEGQPSVPPLAEEGTPDWLKKLEAEASARSAEPSVPAFIFDEETELPPELSQELKGEEQEPEKAGQEAPFPNQAALPEWISQVTAESDVAESQPPEEEQPDLTPAQLPTWLEALRPVEAVAPAAPVGEEQAAQVEKVGPLAGLRGVIPAEPVVGHLRKPPAYSVKLQVTGTQQRNAALLQKLLESEGQVKPIPPRAAFSSQAVLRLVIAVALCVAVLVPLWLNSQQLPLPDPTYIPDGIIETNILINSLKAGAPVLAAIEYEPGLSAEMDAAAISIVNGVISRNASLALVSTNPTGPLLAERLMSMLKRGRGTEIIDYANLGFIAGGPAGLRGFAYAPWKILPYDLGSGGQPPRADLWQVGSLANIRTVSDFAMVLVITEDPENARYWVEQVQPFLQPKSIPLIMVVSAQVEPLVRPYFDAYPRQVNGLVAGLNGAAAYEGFTGQTGLARQYWDAFGSGLLVIEALILVGGLINLMLALFMPRKEAETEGML